jgi:hypothetical protein
MNLGLVDQITKALLYEGYILYPYRASAIKNRQRWNFGVLHPEKYSLSTGKTEPYEMQTQCLVIGNEESLLDVRVRFLHLLMREAGKLSSLEWIESDVEPDHSIVEILEVGEQRFQTWQEAEERTLQLPNLKLKELRNQPYIHFFEFPARREWNLVRDVDQKPAGILVRRQERIHGTIQVLLKSVSDALHQITILIRNLTPCESTIRDQALMQSMASTHTILGIENGEFVSLLEPPVEFSEAAAKCANIGTWPVLVGKEGERDTLLSSPIILYDYPQVAPESAGDLFDSTEIDEILTLRILTLTDEEKAEVRITDERSRKILERSETLPLEQLQKLHGAVRGLREVKERKE